MYQVYVLKSLKSSKRYVGFTSQPLDEKLKEYNEGFSSRKVALKREKYYKSAAGRKHLNKIIPE